MQANEILLCKEKKQAYFFIELVVEMVMGITQVHIIRVKLACEIIDDHNFLATDLIMIFLGPVIFAPG